MSKFAHLELEGGRAVDDTPPMGLQPVEDLASELDGRGVPTGVRRGADSVDPDALGRSLERIDQALDELYGPHILESLCRKAFEKRR